MSENVKKLSFFGRIKKFFADQKGEMKKIVWPSKKQTFNNTKIVLIVVALTAVVVCGFDWLLNAIFSVLVGL
ncbi:MAG: preprotein translocase subunit SecE [Oscillospiraceae bacterium]|nr:preprotein translocase subunit SecE [Oscillospiraceae bacterium]